MKEHTFIVTLTETASLRLQLVALQMGNDDFNHFASHLLEHSVSFAEEQLKFRLIEQENRKPNPPSRRRSRARDIEDTIPF